MGVGRADASGTAGGSITALICCSMLIRGRSRAFSTPTLWVGFIEQPLHHSCDCLQLCLGEAACHFSLHWLSVCHRICLHSCLKILQATTQQLDSHRSQLLLELTDATRGLAYCACVYVQYCSALPLWSVPLGDTGLELSQRLPGPSSSESEITITSASCLSSDFHTVHFRSKK